jgi:hypothetical protein
VNVIVRLEHDVPRIRQGRLWIDLVRNFVEHADILEDYFELYREIAGQFIRPEDIERGIVGPRLRQIKRMDDISVA